MTTEIFVIGVQPPPVHGLSTINCAMLKFLRERNARITSVDLSAGDASGVRFVWLRGWRASVGLLKYIWGALKAPSSTAYLALSGGNGQLLDLLFLIAARLCRSQIVVHHHSFAYLDRHKRLMTLIVCVAGAGATHIVLGENMLRALQTGYKAALHVEVISNAAILPLHAAQNAIRTQVRTVGFLSNITREKGIEDLFAVAEKVGGIRPQVRFVVAGPFMDRELKEEFERRLAASHNVEYVGPVYGADKVKFLSNLDVLLFPTRYQNEAEPLTIHEALGSATPVIANARGCIESILPSCAGRVVKNPDAFAEIASEQICNWVDIPDDYQKASECSRDCFATLNASHKRSLENMLVLLGVDDDYE